LIAFAVLLDFTAVTDAAPVELFGVKTGSVHRMALGGGEITARVVDPGKDGWVLFSITSDDVRWRRGTRIWINLDRIGNISAAMESADIVPATPAGRAPGTALTESELAAMPCFSQVETRDSQAVAKGQSFDRNQFLTECILNQRKKP
jgi:hypothetical protein